MDERDPMTAPSDSGLPVDETGSSGFEMLECSLDVGHGKGDVVKALTPIAEESANRRFGCQRLQNLETRTSDCNHGFLDTLRLDGLARDRFCPVLFPQVGEGCIEIVHGDCDVVDVVRQHPARLPAATDLGRD